MEQKREEESGLDNDRSEVSIGVPKQRADQKRELDEGARPARASWFFSVIAERRKSEERKLIIFLRSSSLGEERECQMENPLALQPLFFSSSCESALCSL